MKFNFIHSLPRRFVQTTQHHRLRALLAGEHAVENWLLSQVGPAYDALKADPSRGLTIHQVRERLAAEHAAQSSVLPAPNLNKPTSHPSR
jgi:hypothetical protein